MFNKLLSFTLHDSSLIISDEVKQNLQKYFEIDIDPNIESQYIEQTNS